MANSAATDRNAAAAKLKAFISYSRSDLAQARAIVAALESKGIACTIDTRDLPYGEKWQGELREFIRGADAIVFLVSPRSIGSTWCKWEVAQVAAQSKRLVPVILEPVPPGDLPPEIGEVHLLPATHDVPFDAAMDSLAAALQSDRAWIKEHTRLGDRATKWISSGRSRDHLLSGQALREAEGWINRRPAAAPQPSQDHLTYIVASQVATKRRGRLVIGLALAASAIFAAAAGAAVWQWTIAVANEKRAVTAAEAEQTARKAEESARKEEAKQKTIAEDRLLEARRSLVATHSAQAEFDLSRLALVGAMDKTLKAAAVEAEYAPPGGRRDTDGLLQRVLTENRLVLNIAGGDADIVKFAFLDENTLVYATGGDIYCADLPARKLRWSTKLPEGAGGATLFAKFIAPVPAFGVVAFADEDQVILLEEKDGKLFQSVKVPGRVLAMDAQPDGDEVGVLTDKDITMIDPSSGEILGSRSLASFGISNAKRIVFDRSDRYLYVVTDEAIVEIDREADKASAVKMPAPALAVLPNVDVRNAFELGDVAPHKDDRKLMFCRMGCGIFDAATGAVTRMDDFSKPESRALGLSFPSDVTSPTEYSTPMLIVQSGTAGDVRRLSVFSLANDGSLQKRFEVGSEIAEHGFELCRTSSEGRGFLACRYTGSLDGIVAWEIGEERPAAVATIAAGEAMLALYRKPRRLSAPFTAE